MNFTTIFIGLLRAYSLYALFGIVILRLLTNKFRRGLVSVPGPSIAAYTSLWKLVDVWRGSAHETHIRLHQKYGPLVRLGPNHISVADPKAIPIIYGVRAKFYKTNFYSMQSISWKNVPRPNLFSEIDPRKYLEKKRLYGHLENLTSILKMEANVDACTLLFVSKLRERSSEPVNLGEWLQYYAFDIVGVLTFAKRFGFLEQGRDVSGIIWSIQMVLAYVSRCGQYPKFHKFLFANPLFPILFPGINTWNAALDFTLKAISDSGTGYKPEHGDNLQVSENVGLEKDALSRLSQMKERDPSRYTTDDIIVHLSANVFVGSDTTATALRAIFYLLCRNPQNMERLVTEIDAKDAAGKLSSPISYCESIEELPYLHAVMKEAMRVCPSVGLMLERSTPPDGVTLSGKFIPGGTIVGINAWVVHRDPNIFPDPEAFKPERWLEASPTHLKVMDQTMFQFGAGPRICQGRWLSLMEMSKVVPQLLRDFRIELAQPEKEWEVQGGWLVHQKGLICRLTPRYYV